MEREDDEEDREFAGSHVPGAVPGEVGGGGHDCDGVGGPDVEVLEDLLVEESGAEEQLIRS